MMCSYIGRIAYLDYCEDELARLVGNSIAHGHLTADEIRKLRAVAGELLLLDRDIGEPVAEPAGEGDCLVPACRPGSVPARRPGSTVH